MRQRRECHWHTAKSQGIVIAKAKAGRGHEAVAFAHTGQQNEVCEVSPRQQLPEEGNVPEEYRWMCRSHCNCSSLDAVRNAKLSYGLTDKSGVDCSVALLAALSLLRPGTPLLQ